MLTPATPEDLRANGTISSPAASYDDEKGQMKISVVATITQTLDPDGKPSFSVEPPDPDEDHGKIEKKIENFSAENPVIYLSKPDSRVQSRM